MNMNFWKNVDTPICIACVSIKVQKRQTKFSAISPVTGTSMRTRSTDGFSAHHQSDTGLKNWDKPNIFSADFVFIYFWVKNSEILVEKSLKRHFFFRETMSDSSYTVDYAINAFGFGKYQAWLTVGEFWILFIFSWNFAISRNFFFQGLEWRLSQMPWKWCFCQFWDQLYTVIGMSTIGE